MNTKPILHDFEVSPFSEKVRLAFGAGVVHVHFPRFGYRVQKASTA